MKVVSPIDDWFLYCGDCIEVLHRLKDCCADSIVTDPPAGIAFMGKDWDGDKGGRNKHPTVKSTKLMAYLCRLVTPPGGTVLDPFMGSGSTGVAALAEGFEFIGIEQELTSFQTAQARMEAV